MSIPGLTKFLGNTTCPDEPGIVQVLVTAAVKSPVVTGNVEQRRLNPRGRWDCGFRRNRLPQFAAACLSEQGTGLADAMHPGEEQLLALKACQIRRENDHLSIGLGLQAGLQPTQPAVALLRGHGPAAS
ncbi:hypothetical protein ABT300_23110 [Streptomyces sp. NPDC001027]|uniref:hypothetical protein n=1 Tax=Streptomyces sp. NPDC001027 TaxID=3154771 RepID=UPI00331D57DD